MRPLHVHREWVLFHGARHVALSCFYSSSEQTNQTLALERAFYVFASFTATVGSPTRLEVELVVICNLLQDATKSYTLAWTFLKFEYFFLSPPFYIYFYSFTVFRQDSVYCTLHWNHTTFPYCVFGCRREMNQHKSVKLYLHPNSICTLY